MKQNQIMTLKEFAKKYRVCSATVGKWRERGFLDVLQVGSRVLITPENEANFVKRHTKSQHHKIKAA